LAIKFTLAHSHKSTNHLISEYNKVQSCQNSLNIYKRHLTSIHTSIESWIVMQPLRFLVVMERDFSVIRGRKTLTPREPNTALNEKCFVVHDKPHDNRFIIPEPISSRTRRKLLLRKGDENQASSDAEVNNEMEPSSEDEEDEEDATCCWSLAHAVYNGTSGVVGEETTMPGSGVRATKCLHHSSRPRQARKPTSDIQRTCYRLSDPRPMPTQQSVWPSD